MHENLNRDVKKGNTVEYVFLKSKRFFKSEAEVKVGYTHCIKKVNG